jgi:DNA-binding transcriptional MerR regulator
MDEEILTVSKVAEILDCHPETVRRLERRGLLTAKRDYRRFRIFDLKDVLQLKKDRELLIDGGAENGN